MLLARVVVGSRLVSALLRRFGVERTIRLLRPHCWSARRPHALDSRRTAVLTAFADPRTSRWTAGACLERSILLYRLLNQAGVPVDLTIGLRSVAGVVDGHAWLAMAGRPVLEPVDPRVDFQPTLCYPSPLSAEAPGRGGGWVRAHAEESR